MSEVKRVSVYHLGKNVLNVAPQQLYSMISNGSFPKELYEYQQVGERIQPMVDQEAAVIWWESKGKVVKFAVMLDLVVKQIEVDNPKLAKQVLNWWTKKREVLEGGDNNDQ